MGEGSGESDVVSIVKEEFEIEIEEGLVLNLSEKFLGGVGGGKGASLVKVVAWIELDLGDLGKGGIL